MSPTNAVGFPAPSPAAGLALHISSRIRGRLAALELALAVQDTAARIRVTAELVDLFDQLLTLTGPDEPAASEAPPAD
jgi:hypothetical protein